MKALLVIDVQRAHVELGDFTKELNKMEELIQSHQKEGELVVLIQHVDDNEESPLYRNSEKANLYEPFLQYGAPIVRKQTPSSFYKTDLERLLQEHDVDHVTITGFNTEYCCLFTSIAAFDRGYEVTFEESATASVNDEDTYDMKGLDIRDFVGSVLNWSGVVDVRD